jgi:hypothetical protein
LELVQQELEQKLSRLTSCQVQPNNQIRLEIQFNLANLYKRKGLHKKASQLYHNISAEVITKGITDQWYLPPAAFTHFNPGYINFDAPLPTPKELKEERMMLLY